MLHPSFILVVLAVAAAAWTLVIVGGVQAAAPPAAPTDAACLAWDISGEWQYRASLGGYGTMNFQQDEAGNLTGAWHNVAGGGSGNLAGEISGASVHFRPTESEEMWATVAPDGKKMSGTFTAGDEFGTWEATGSAECLRRTPPPVEGTANVTVRWGNHIYRRIIRMQTATVTGQALTQVPPAGLPVITFLGDTSLDIEIIYYGEDLPPTLTVLDRVNGQDVVIGTLQREILNDGRVRYRGRVTVSPRGTIAPGQRQTHDVIVIDPWGREVWVARIVMQLIDPSGFIRDANTSAPIEGAIASNYQRVGGEWVLWDAAQFAQTNPQPSNSSGYYGWDVPQGEYKVKVSKKCYADAESGVLTVPPPRTDVHFNLTPLQCSKVEISDVWTSNDSSVPALDFLPGQKVDTHIQISNAETNDVTLVVTWTTTDPDGQVAPELSGTNTFILPPNGAIDVKVGGRLPANAKAGTYVQTTETTHNQQTSMLVSQFNVLEAPGLFLPIIIRSPRQVSTPTPTATPPPPTATPTPTGPTGIHGQVTYNNTPAPGIELSLREYNGDETTVVTTTTDAQGRYGFEGVPTLPGGHNYYVRFGPNSANDNYVYVWFGPDITSYTAGASVPGGDFDIADVRLTAPPHNSTQAFPVNFTWDKRPVTTDTYRLILFDPDTGSGWRTDDLGYVGSGAIAGLPSGGQYGKVYGWYPRPYNGEGSYGIPYYYRHVTFSSSAADVPDVKLIPMSRLGVSDRSELHPLFEQQLTR